VAKNVFAKYCKTLQSMIPSDRSVPVSFKNGWTVAKKGEERKGVKYHTEDSYNLKV